MTYKVLGRRPAQVDTHQDTQMTHQLQLSGAGGIRPPEQRTLLGHSEDRGPGGTHGFNMGSQGNYTTTSTTSGNMQLSMPAYQQGSVGKPFYGAHTPAPPADRTPPKKTKTRGFDSIQRPQF